MLALTEWLNPWEWSGDDLALLTALGTFGAVVIALSGGFLRWRGARRRRPLVSMSFDRRSETAVEEMVYLDGSGKEDAAFVRLAVSNARGRDAAQDVRVHVVRLQQLDAPKEYGTLFSLWADDTRINFPPLGWTHLVATEQTLGPGLTLTVDLGWKMAGEDRFTLGVKPPPNRDLYRLYPGTYDITLAVGGRNFDGKHYRVRIAFDGKGTTVDFWDHIEVVAPPEAVEPPS